MIFPLRTILDTERIQKAIRRSGGRDFAAIREQTETKPPVEMASERELGERRNFLHQTRGTSADAEAAFERIIQGNELQDVNYLVRGSHAARSVGRISIREPNGTLVGYGTGFLIGSRVLLTNNHVLSDAVWAGRSEVEFDYQRDENGRQMAGVKFSLDPAALFHTSEELDFSVVALSPRAVNGDRDLDEFGCLPLIAGKGKAIEGEWLTIIQHPRGELKQVCVRENRLLEKNADVLWYSTDTLGGASGSPVFNNDWQVVALHHSGVPEVKNGNWQTIDGRDYDKRIHREEDIKWVANEGIRVSRIVDTLQREVGSNALIQAALDVTPSEISAQMPQPEAIPTTMNPPSPIAINPALAGQKFVLSFDAAGNPAIGPLASSATAEFIASAALEKATVKPKPKAQPKGVSFKFDENYDNRAGYQQDFLGKGKYRVHLPKLSAGLKASAAKLLEPTATNNHILNYTNMSIVMHARRRFAIYSAANVDMAVRYAVGSKRVWRYDDRITREEQVGPEAYAGNQFDKGHLTRQEDMEYGATILEALQSTADTCHWTNCVLQHAKFNRTQEWWQGMEQHILEHAIKPEAKGFPAQVFTGPVFSELDPVYDILPGIQVPMKFWKVCAAVTSSGKLFAVAYLLDQSPVIKQYGVKEAAGAVPFEPYKLFQLPIAELQEMIQLKFTYGTNASPLSDCDPLKNGTPPELDANQDGYDDRQENFVEGSAAPEGWVDMTKHRPFFG